MSQMTSRALAATWLLILFLASGGAASGKEPFPALSGEDSETVRGIIDDARCPCRCGRYLPGSRKNPACFGCSVGKAEVTRIVEGFLAGKELLEIIVGLNEPAVISVYSDYTNPELADMWDRAQRVAAEFNQHRVVLRVFGRTDEARRAVKLAEYSRGTGRFTELQNLLIHHQGPWDDETLITLAARAGLDPQEVRKNYKRTDVADQMRKDRAHSRQDKVKHRPSLTVNGKIVENTDDALRDAIRDVVEDGSI